MNTIQKLTIVICTHNRANLLIKTIKSINEALIPNNCTIKILVIANACTDNTIIQLNSYQSKQNKILLPLTVIEEPRPGKSFALNHAIDIIDIGFIGFIDDDQRVDINYLVATLEAINQSPEISFFCGPIYPDWTGKEPEWVHTQGKYKIYPEPIPSFNLGSKVIKLTKDMMLPGGGTLIIKREVFTKISSFSTKLGPKGHNLVGGEDSDFVLRALASGETIQYIPSIIQYHYVAPSRLKLSNLLLTSFQRTRSFTLVTHPLSLFPPLYMWRKLFTYIFFLLITFKMTKKRFYLMRVASTAGEMFGFLEKKTL